MEARTHRSRARLESEQPPQQEGNPAGLSSCSGGLRPLVELCVEPAGLCGRCTGVAVPLRVVPSPTRVARGSASWLSSHGRGLGPQDALKRDYRGLSRVVAGKSRFPRPTPPIPRSALEKDPRPGPLFKGNPVGEGTTRRGTANPVHRPQRPAGSTHSSTRGLPLRGTLGSSLRSPAEGEGHEGFPPPPLQHGAL